MSMGEWMLAGVWLGLGSIEVVAHLAAFSISSDSLLESIFLTHRAQVRRCLYYVSCMLPPWEERRTKLLPHKKS